MKEYLVLVTFKDKNNSKVLYKKGKTYPFSEKRYKEVLKVGNYIKEVPTEETIELEAVVESIEPVIEKNVSEIENSIQNDEKIVENDEKTEKIVKKPRRNNRKKSK